jgi:hypothetical protein
MLCSRRMFNYVISYRLIQKKRKLFEDPQVYIYQEEENTIEDSEILKIKLSKEHRRR